MKIRMFALLVLILSMILCGSAESRKNFIGIHELAPGCVTPIPTLTSWCQNLVGPGGYCEDWLPGRTDWLQEVYSKGMIPICRVQTNSGSPPDIGAMCGWIDTMYNWKMNSQWADYPLYCQIWNEPGDSRDYLTAQQYTDLLIAIWNHCAQLDTNDTLFLLTPGQNGPDFWYDCGQYNPNWVNCFDVWGTHPYPYSYPPSYNYHDDSTYVNTTIMIDSYVLDLDEVARQGRRGVRVMCTETGWGLYTGNSIEGYPKTTREMAAAYMVDAYQNYWYKWVEVQAVCPFLLQAPGWEEFAWVSGSSGDNNGWPTGAYPQYTAVANMTKPTSGFGPVDRSPKGTIRGTVRRAGTGSIIKYASVSTDNYDFGDSSLYDGQYMIRNVTPGTYTLKCEKYAHQTATQQITVVAGQETVVDFNLTYLGNAHVGIYFNNGHGGTQGCSGCNIGGAFVGQTFVTPADCACIVWAACMTNVACQVRFSILDGGPTGTQIGPSITVQSPGIDMIGAAWADGQVPVQGNHTYFLKVERVDGQSIYCYMNDTNPYPDGMAYTHGGTPHPTWDMYSCIKGKTALVTPPNVGTIVGNVKNASAQNLVGATVSTTTGGYTATTNSSGNYTIANVPTGTYSVAASKAGYTTNTQTGKVVNTNQTTTVNFTLSTAPTGAIAGNVKNTSGVNLSGATITTNTGGYTATTDANGNYTIASVNTGTYDVTAARAGYNSSTLTGRTVSSGATTTCNYTLTSAAPFTGISNGNFEGGFYNDPDIDHKSATSWHRFSVSGASKCGGWYGTYHSADWSQAIWESSWTAGFYQQATNTTVGNKYTASVWVRGTDANQKFWVGIDPTGGTSGTSANIQWSSECIPNTTWTQISKQVTATATTVTVFIKAQNLSASNKYAYFDDAALVDDGPGAPPTTGTLSGNVKDGAGANVSGATVSTTSGGYTTTSDAGGNYTLSNVNAGTYSVVASKSGYNSQTQTGKTVTAGATTTCSFTITRQTGTIAGNVKDGSGVNVSGATVSTTTGGYTTTTNSSGNYTISSVATGTYDVVASKSGYNSQTQTGKTVNNAATTTVNFTITAQGGIASESFDTLPNWTSTYDAPWGSAATFSSVTGGQSGNCMQASRTSQGSSSKVKVYTVPTNTNITISCYMKCPSYANSYWMETAFKLGSNTAQNYDSDAASWTLIKKFSNSGTNGNGNTWTQYSATVNTGSNTQISIGYKHGSSGYTGPTCWWDTFLIQ